MPARNHPVVSRIVARWRQLTANPRGDHGRRTLIACSGGADSSALLLALAATGRSISVAYILHDMRPLEAAEADRDAVASLAATLHVPFHEASVSRVAGENIEASYRRQRYAALAALAAREQYPFVATGHHADDQLETILLRIARGAGPTGLAGIAPRRPLAPGITVIRPMLTTLRAEAESLCRDCGWQWRDDVTNADETRARGFLRRRVIPELRSIAPSAARHASHVADDQRAVRALLSHLASAIPSTAQSIPDGQARTIEWAREDLRPANRLVVGEALRTAAQRLLAGRGMDHIGRKQIAPAVKAIRAPGTDPRTFQWSGLVVRVTAHRVTLTRREDS